MLSKMSMSFFLQLKKKLRFFDENFQCKRFKRFQTMNKGLIRVTIVNLINK